MKLKKRLILVIVLVVLALASLGVGVYLDNQHPDKLIRDYTLDGNTFYHCSTPVKAHWSTYFVYMEAGGYTTHGYIPINPVAANNSCRVSSAI
jgi:hypothetical protein